MPQRLDRRDARRAQRRHRAPERSGSEQHQRNTLVLKPSETLTGSIKAFDRLPNLRSALEKSDVVIFCIHQLRTVDGATSERLNGATTLKKDKT